MRTLTNYLKNCNNSPRQFHYNCRAPRLRQSRSRPRRMVFDASIELSRCGNCICAAITIYHHRHKVDHSLVQLRDCTEERGWYQAYQVAQKLADKHSEGSRIFIRQEVNKAKTMRRAA